MRILAPHKTNERPELLLAEGGFLIDAALTPAMFACLFRFIVMMSFSASLLLSEEQVASPATAARLLADEHFADYHGWLKYLAKRIDFASSQSGAQSEQAKAARERLDDWCSRIGADPTLLSKLRGVQEWAYESPVDGSGQPFKICIPSDYDPAAPRALTITLHGYSGNHLEHSTGAKEGPGAFAVFVLGRARGGWYVGLSQADVLHVIDYVQAHWNIDARRLRLAGGSMGGGGTFKLGSRFPHRFASGQITCGYSIQEPVTNLTGFPIYATHSDDDPVVPILLARSTLSRLRELGSPAIFDEAHGFGHAVWDYSAGNLRSAAWAVQQVLPSSKEIKYIDFTVLDGSALRSWWAELSEWGASPRPARFIVTALAHNQLQVRLENVRALRLCLRESPVDVSRELSLSIDGAVPLLVPAPLPEYLEIVSDPLGWKLVDESFVPPVRLHTPGGPLQVYDGSPLLIVYGTHGEGAAKAHLKEAALAASKSPHPAWLHDRGEAAADGVPHSQNLYGRLPIRADSELTETELQSHNLVLIGTASENSIVARLAAQLPLRFVEGTLSCTDGTRFPSESRGMLGLVHFNPLAPLRLLFWVAASNPEDYQPNALVPELGSQFFIGADLLWVDASQRRLVATRSFDSHWAWNDARPASRVLPAALHTNEALSLAIAEAARRETGADFGVATQVPGLGDLAITEGQTHVSDLKPLFYSQAIDLLELSGSEILSRAEQLETTASGAQTWVRLTPDPRTLQLRPERLYRLALPTAAVSPFGRATLCPTKTQRRTEHQMDLALEHWLAY